MPADEHREYVAVVCFRNCCVAGDFNQQVECVCGRSVSVVCSIPFDNVDTASCGQDDESLPDSRTVDAAITHSTDPVPEKDKECDCEDCSAEIHEGAGCQGQVTDEDWGRIHNQKGAVSASNNIMLDALRQRFGASRLNPYNVRVNYEI